MGPSFTLGIRTGGIAPVNVPASQTPACAGGKKKPPAFSAPFIQLYPSAIMQAAAALLSLLTIILRMLVENGPLKAHATPPVVKGTAAKICSYFGSRMVRVIPGV